MVNIINRAYSLPLAPLPLASSSPVPSFQEPGVTYCNHVFASGSTFVGTQTNMQPGSSLWISMWILEPHHTSLPMQNYTGLSFVISKLGTLLPAFYNYDSAHCLTAFAYQ